MAGIPYVFTISHVAKMLGEDACPAFTEYGIECLRQIILEERALAAVRKPDRTA